MNELTTKYFVAAQLNLEKFARDRRGVTAIEYALIGVAMATLLAFVLGDQNSGFLGR
ncbi:Flp pilus assembly protein, pilin Flp [Serratia rubidaea]|uniref:Flp pilus assembly protein, pilin Flp n=1 Tax=Serratia rubidaea TaxID=61652 RepID=A0A3S4FTE4_SERRU|nr:Flp pilus assembly protein, pilin Flp [Serratia rubidaea]